MNYQHPVAAVAALVASFVSISMAAPLRAETVRYGDLNVASAEGSAQLDARLQQAAKKVCGNGEAAIVAIACRQQVVSAAKAQLASKSATVLASR
jgi:UrcA family protein